MFLILLQLTVAQGVDERGGDIYFWGSRGELTRVTSSGRDRSPSLSPDGSCIIFVRNVVMKDSGVPIGDAVGPEFGRSQLWTYDVRTGHPPRLLLDSPINVKGRNFYGFYDPQFSADESEVYFQIAFAATSGAIIRLHPATKQVEFVTNAIAFAVVPLGKYVGDLIAQQHRSKLSGGYYDWFYVMSPDGKEISVVGEIKSDVYNFADTYIGDVNACEGWNTPAWLRFVSRIRKRDEDTITR